MWLVTLLSATMLLQPAASVFETEIAPGEGLPRLRATGPLQLRDQPDTTRPGHATVHLPLNRDLTFDATIYRTVRPGELRVQAATEIVGRLLGPIKRLSREEYYRGRYSRGSVAVARSGSIEYLQSRAEGHCFVRIDGNVIEADRCPAADTQSLALVREPTTEWWVRITRDSSPLGWVLVDDKQIKVVGRSF